ALTTGSSGNDAHNNLFTISGTTLSVGNTPLAAGTYNIYLSATDTAGNVSYLAQTFTVNTVPTVTSIVRAGGASASVAANATSLSYTVTFSESVTGVDASDFSLTSSGTASGAISGISGSGTTYTVTVNTLTGDGAMRLDLKASGTGIQSGASVAVGGGYTAGATFALDHTAPAAPLAFDLRTADDTGSSSTDNLTSVTTPVFTGTAEAGSTVTLSDTDGSTVLGSAEATGGNWSITSNTLTPGSHTLTVKATDAAGNVSAASSALVVVVDTTAPSALALSSNTVATANASSGATVATLSATDSAVISYALATGNGVNNADNASFVISGNTLSVGNAQLTPGTYHIYLSATDAAGNVSNLAQTINVVNAPSVVSIVRAGGAGATLANNATSTTFTVTFSESVTGVDASDFTLTATNTASGVISNVTGSGSTYTITVGSLSGDGQLRLDLKSSGTGIQNGSSIAIAGGYSSGASYVLDHTAPAAPLAFDLRTADDSGSSSTDNITSVTTPVFTGTAEAGSTITLYDTDGTTVLGSAVATGGNWSITSSTLSEGSHTLTVKATDAAGNVSAASSALAVVVDTTAPTGLALSQTTVASGTTGPGATVATLSGSDSNGPLVYALATGDTTNDSGNGNFNLVGNVLSVRGSGLLPGSYNVYLSATDAAGNVSHLAQTINVVDAPSVTSIVRAGGASATVAASAASATFTVTFSESVTGVDASDFALTATNTASGVISNVTGSGATYTVTVGTLSGDGDLRLDLNPSGTGIANGSAVGILSGYSGGASYTLDHTAPLAPSRASMSSLTDTGVSQTDGITRNTTPTFTGTAEANATVRLYDTDGTTVLGSATADGSGNWSITSNILAEGNHTLTVRQTDRAGNVSPSSSALTVVIDTSAAAPAAPTLAPVSDSGVAGDGITYNNSPTINGTAEAFAAITLYATDGVTVLGTGTANSSGAWSIVPSSALPDGTHTLTARQTDRAGNNSAASTGLVLVIDTTPPVAPGVPVLAVASDSGTAGDNITNISQPTLTGTAAPNAIVRLYDTDGTTVLGSAVADSSGNWSITSSTLSVGAHTLSARQLDVAGNLSSAGVTLSLTIEAPPPPPQPPVTPQPPMVDGVPVTQQPVTLPGGGSGTQIVVPIITSTRTDDTGNSAVADIPLASTSINGTSSNLLLAQIAPGIGLSATGGASAPAGDPQQQLIQAIVAATPGHASSDQGHLTGNGITFLNQLAASVPLLVQTITPVSNAGASGGSLTLTGTSTDAQHTALVIDTGGLPSGATLQLNAVDFAAIVGAASVVANTNNQILTGDQAAQQFTVSAATSSNVFSGGGSDTLVFNSIGNTQGGAASALRQGADIPAAANTSTSVLHGGAGLDTATFNGASSDYTIVRHQSYVTVASTAQPQQKAVLINVESLKFSDATIAVETRESLTAIAGLYRDVLGRQADYLGIDSWARSELAGASLGEIAIGIINSVESQARQARVFNGDNAHDIELLYQSIFSRPSDAGGLALWIQFMNDGASLEQVATHFVLSEEMQAHKIGVPQWDFSMG
ncbi:MAG: Ig-like domain-containing protein, partial [Duganella sp.]